METKLRMSRACAVYWTDWQENHRVFSELPVREAAGNFPTRKRVLFYLTSNTCKEMLNNVNRDNALTWTHKQLE
jgi:hypothetical protein